MRHASRALLACAAGALTLTGCGNSAPGVSTAGNSDGVTAAAITVGGIASLSGPIPADFSGIFDGASAYFDMVNAAGGVYGRQIEYPFKLDDASDPTTDVAVAHTLVEQDHVFAIVGVGTPEFKAAGYLVQNDVPTFGYAITPTWSSGANLFGAEGSYVDFLNPGPEPAFLAQRVGAKRVGVLSYGVTESQQACEGFESVLQRYGVDVVFHDTSVPVPALDLSTEAIRMRAAHVQMVISCMDLSGNVLLAQALRQQQITGVTQYWLNGYDDQALHQYESLMQGIYFLIPHAPFELTGARLQRYPGLQLYLAELAKYFPQDSPNEASLAGWLNADLFVTGLRKLGPHVAPTRERLVAAINSLADYTADGVISPITWRDEHDANGPFDCNVYVQVRGTRFVPVFGSPPSVFTCFRYPEPAPTRVLVPIPPPAPVPGS